MYYLQFDMYTESLHFENRIDNKSLKTFIDLGCKGLYQYLDKMNEKEKDFIEYIERFTESTFADLFISTYREGSSGEALVLRELGVSKSKDKWGRIDVLIKDLRAKQIFILECKSFWSSENEPNSEHWEKGETKSFYNSVLKQAKEYVVNESFINQYPYSLTAIAFARIEFNNEEKTSDWVYHPEKNEFYSFKTFRRSAKIIGLATYGKSVSYK